MAQDSKFLTKTELEIIFKYLSKNPDKSNGMRGFLTILLMLSIGRLKSSMALLDVKDFEPQNRRILSHAIRYGFIIELYCLYIYIQFISYIKFIWYEEKNKSNQRKHGIFF